jgi:hypothetical protein
MIGPKTIAKNASTRSTTAVIRRQRDPAAGVVAGPSLKGVPSLTKWRRTGRAGPFLGE